MFKKKSDYVLVFSVSVILTLLLSLYLRMISLNENIKPSFQISLENASHKWNDLFYKAKSTNKPNDNVVVLAIDEESIIEVGRWPWSRSTVNQITKNLLKHDVKTIAYDIIFSEKENSIVDSNFVKTIATTPEKLIFGTYSGKLENQLMPYQDFCLTQAFLYTGGDKLIKINPSVAVDDESNKFEVYPYNQLLTPLFNEVEKASEQSFLKEQQVSHRNQLTPFQLNTLKYTNESRVYEYCKNWLTPQDPYKYSENPNLKNLYMSVFGVTREQELEAIIKDLTTNTMSNPVLQYSMWRQNIEEIQNISNYTASFISLPDKDGVVRNYPLILRTGNTLGTSYIPSLAMQAYLVATGYQALFKISTKQNKKVVESVEIRSNQNDEDQLINKIPADTEAKILINYYGKGHTLSYISAKDLLNDSDYLSYYTRSEELGQNTSRDRVTTVKKSEFLKNKNIIFGATAIGIYDIRTTPIDINFPGPEIHATMLSNLLSQHFLSYDKNETKNSPFIFFAFIFISTLLFAKLGIRWAAVAYVFLTITLYLIQNFNYTLGVVYQSSLLYYILLFLSFFICFVYKYFFQSRKSKEIKRAFSKYVSKDVVNEILENESAIELRGQKLHMTVYFSDIRGFTSFSEKMDPVELSTMLNRYFTPMSEIITKHRGTIDKYIGDAIMAMFGAPINYQDHAVKACHAALECVKVLEKINEEFREKNWPKIDIGIGINTGYMNAGNIGSETIQNYTVIGDSVNLCSRLESLTKEYGVKIIISHFTYEIIKDQFKCRELDKVQVKGKKEPVTIYELQDSL